MTAFSTSLGRFQSMRRRDSKKKPVQPIDVDAAKQYHHPGPSSAASTSLLTPRPHHYRSTTPSPATPAASTFASPSMGPASTRFVSSPTFVSSTALAADLDSLTPPLSPVHPSSAAAAQASKSPLRRALSRSFFFGGTHSTNQPSPDPRISSPIPRPVDVPPNRATRPARPARPATSPATAVSPKPNAFGFTAAAMSRSQTSGPIIITPPVDVPARPRSRTLMPPLSPTENHSDQLATSQRSTSSSWSARFSRTPSPVPFIHTGTSAPDTCAELSSPRTSLRSIRQRHARKSIHSIFGTSPVNASRVAPESIVAVATAKPVTSDAAPLLSLRRRLIRRASEESFHCRGPDFDAPPAADTRPSIDNASAHSLGLHARPAPAAVPRSSSMYSCSHPAATQSSGARRMSEFTISSYQEKANASSPVQPNVQDILSEIQAEHDAEHALAGLGFVDPVPAAPRVLPKRLSATSQASLTESIPASTLSSSSTVSLSSVENQLSSSWPDTPTMQTWFSTCPPTPPSSIRLELQFRSLPPPSPVLLSSSTMAERNDTKPRPLSGIFISSNSSVLDLKEAIVTRMHDLGYRLSPKNLSLILHLNEDVRTQSKTALGLNLSVYGKNPAKVLDDSSRLLFEEGAQEEDLVVVDCDPSHVLWSI
ncbi:hypothetical protein EX895_001608 [Sporisorium graminicola]|uniref:Uncharacterized protein n=1 Tax=Sporisorium graminicola TaxID=280036 RepID=A0A4U7KXT8_9BASI|nr:hypothetical protein EX895_001608 [Sporisorium graminicola]TKY89077.1 hypothetical protein EX895_001608 [Sporisorium graminicola]